MKKVTLGLLTVALVTFIAPSLVISHCEVPCGVYGDTMRISMLYENITTVEKAMVKIAELSAEKNPDWNQIVRWVQNKETHATNIQHIVTQYFMTQRVKATHKKYTDLLTTLHQMLVSAMKTKQSTEKSHISMLRAQVASLTGLYFNEADQKHIKEHHPEGK